MKKRVLISVLLVVIVSILGSVHLSAQAAQNGEGDEGGIPQVLGETLDHLREAGWTGADLNQIQERAEEQNWDEIETADPEVVAMALQLAHQNRRQLEGAEKADLAFQLAKMTQTMGQLGFDRREIARASFEGTREAVRSIEEFRKNKGPDTMKDKDSEQLREQVREQIKNRINTAMENRVRTQEKASSRNKPGPHTSENSVDADDNAPDLPPGRPDKPDHAR